MTAERDRFIPAVALVVEDEGQEPEPDRGDVEEQAFWNRTARVKAKVQEFDIEPEALRKSVDDITKKLGAVLDNQRDRPVNGFALESFSVGLALSATGKLFLVAEVGVEASIELTFARPKA